MLRQETVGFDDEQANIFTCSPAEYIAFISSHFITNEPITFNIHSTCITLRVFYFIRHLPYNATPAYLKEKTDAALKLLDEINTKTIDENKMTPREVKALEQVLF